MKASPYEIPKSLKAPMLIDGTPDFVLCEHNNSYVAVAVTPFNQHLFVKFRNIPHDVTVKTHPVENENLSVKQFYSIHPVVELKQDSKFQETEKFIVYSIDLLTKEPPSRYLCNPPEVDGMIKKKLDAGCEEVPFRFPEHDGLFL